MKLLGQEFDLDRLVRLKEELEIDAIGYTIVGPENATIARSLLEEPKMWPIFRVGSISKIIVAIGIMHLVEQDQIDLDDGLKHYLPDLDFKNDENNVDPILVRHLLSHTSGLNEMGFSAYYVEDGALVGSLSSIVHQLENQFIRRRRPGECYIYSNLNYLLLARIIEVVTGTAANKWLEDEVLLPLGMRGSYFDVGESRYTEDEMRGIQDGKTVKLHRGMLYPALGLMCSMDDLGYLVKFLASNGQVNGKQFLSVASLRQIAGVSEDQNSSGNPIRPGFGLAVQDAFHSGVWTGEGGVEGFSTWLKVHPESGKGIAVSVNQSSISARDKQDIETALGWNHNLGFTEPRHCENDTKAKFKWGYFSRINARNAIFQIYDDLYSGVFIHESRTDSGRYILETIEGHMLKIQICGMGDDSLDPNLPLAYLYESANGKSIFEIDNWQFERENDYWLPLIRGAVRFIFFYAVILLVIGLPRAIQQTIKQQLKWNTWILCTILNIIPYWAAYLGFEMLISGNFYELGHFGGYSFTLLVLSLSIPISTCLGFFWLVKQKYKQDNWLKILNLFQFIFNSMLCIYLAAYGFLPFASWLH